MTKPRVLAVDDERLVRSALSRTYRADFDLTFCSSAMEALELIRAGNDYAAILCDLMMPMMTGMDLYAQLAEERPDQVQRMIFFSGGSTPQTKEFLARVPNERIGKPFDVDVLRRMLHARIAAG
jgi:CheY-like chemotaxis protein